MNEWIKPYVDTSKWEFYDLSCKARDDTNDQVLRDAIAAGKRLGSIYKEPTITPTAAVRPATQSPSISSAARDGGADGGGGGGGVHR